jgi:uncharacterized protein
VTTRRFARTILIALALSWSFIAGAQVPVPALTGHVIDQTATLSSEQKTDLEQTLQTFEAGKGSQLVVLIVPSTTPEAIEQYALRVAEQWKLGRKKVDDGAILVVAKNDRALRIEVGYGLEGALNDATSKRIISEIITPFFKQGDYYGGITAGVSQIIRVVDGEPLPEPSAKAAQGNPELQQYFPILLLLALAIGFVFHAVFGKVGGALATGSVIAVITWFFVGALSIALAAGMIGLLLSLVSGTSIGRGLLLAVLMGGRGGSGRGGFGGGGGGFGGGGASGRW